MIGPIRLSCPTCDAHAGERCVDEEGHLLEYFHRGREIRAARISGTIEMKEEPTCS